MGNQYKSTYRCYLIDHHSPDPPVISFDHLEMTEYEKFFRTANIDSLMLYCKDHWGACYYDSDVPDAHKHPGLGGRDYVAEVEALARRLGLEFVAYYCLEYDEGAARSHPEWRVQKPDGSGLIRDDLYAKWSLDCLRTGYGEYCLAQLEEICTKYRPDALFLDIFGTSLCYCPKCRAAYLQRFGYPMPEGEPAVLEHEADVSAFCTEFGADFMDRLRTRLHRIDPSLAITINFASHYPLSMRRKLDYQFSEPVLQDNWFSAAYTRDTAKGRYPIMMPGEFSAVYNYLPAARYITDLSEIAAQGCRVGLYSGSQHPDGSLDMEEAERIGAAYRQIEAIHPYLDGRSPIRYAGILQSDRCAQIGLHSFPQDAILRLKQSEPHTRALLGAMKLCEQAKIPWNVIPEEELDRPEDYALLILPEFYVVTPELAEKLRRYAASGGTILASAGCGLWSEGLEPMERSSLEDLLGVRVLRVNRQYMRNGWSAYLRPCEPLGGIFDCGTTPPISSFFVESALCGAKPILKFELPCVACDETHWVNWWSPPPGYPTDFPAATCNPMGKGCVYYTAFDLFTMAADGDYACTDDFFAAVLRACPQPPLRNLLDAPQSVRTSFGRRADGTLVIHQISQMPKLMRGEVIPVSGGILQGSPNMPMPESARCVFPEEKALPIHAAPNGWEIVLPAFSLQQTIEIR